MASFGAFVFSRQSDLNELSLELDKFVEVIGENLQRTRKGNDWRFWIAERPFHIAVRVTSRMLELVEEDLLEKNLLPEDAPYTVVVSSGLGSKRDRTEVLGLVSRVAEISDGIATDVST